MNLFARAAADLVMRRLTGVAPGKGSRERRRGEVEERAVDAGRFGVRVEDPACRERIGAILRAFFLGFERSFKLGTAPARGIDPLLQPFYCEGAAMGCLPHGCLRLERPRRSLERFEEVFGREDDPALFLRYVGLGFWLGFRHPRRPERMEREASRLQGRRFRHLVHDGYGFRLGLFELSAGGEARGRGKEAGASGVEGRAEGGAEGGAARVRALAARLGPLAGFGRLSALNGLGRSLWFHFMDRPEAALRAAAGLERPEEAAAVAGGLGLAAAFTFTDDLSRAYGIAGAIEGEDTRRHFVKGIRIALYVRGRCDRAFLERSLAALAPELRARAMEDTRRAEEVGEATSRREDFIAAFHAGCLDG